MAYTTLTDLELPESLAGDITDKSVESSKFFNSGAVAVLPGVDILPTQGTTRMPFWNDLSGSSQPTHNGVNLTVNGVTQGHDRAAVLARGKAWGSEDLAAAFKGDDPIGFITGRVGEYWGREKDRIAVQNLMAALATTASGASMAANVLNIGSLTGAPGIVDDDAMIDAAGLLGDMDDDLSLVLMHSNVRRFLEKANVVEDYVPSEGKVIKVYRQREVISHDRLTATANVYPIIFVGRGAFGYADAAPKKPTAITRDELTNGGQEAFVSRQLFTMHPRGIAFTGDPAGQTPTDAELATASNWSRKWTAKNIKITILKARIA